MRHFLLATALVTSSLIAAPAGAQTPAAPRVLTLSFDPDGRVNLKAQSVTIRDILSEWARQCGCYVVNAQKIAGGPIALPFQFDHAPQRQVLESLLRQVSGYTLTPRREGSTSVSAFETIHITPSSVATQSTYATPLMAPTPDDEIPPVVPSPLRVDPNAGQPPVPPQQPGAQPQQPGSQSQQPGSQSQQPGSQGQQSGSYPQPPAPRAGGVVVPIVGVGGPPVGPTPGSAGQAPRPAGSPAPAPAAPGTPTGR